MMDDADAMNEDEVDPIHMQGLEWFVLMNDMKASAKDRLAFNHWLEADSAHRAAYERAQALWNRFDVVIPEYTRLRRQGGISRRGLMFAGLGVFIGASGLYALSDADLFADFRTDVAERRSFLLPDGSIVELGGYSAASLDFGAGERRLRLYRGQAFLQVAAEPVRPFVVEAGGGTITALGTQFDVHLIEDRTVVSIIEHAVEVRVGKTAPIRADADWQVSYDSSGARPATRADMAAVQNWRHGRLVFSDMPLRQVIADLERYRRGRILLADRSIGDIPVTAVFDIAKIDDVLPAMAETLPVRIFNAKGYVTVLYRR